MFGPLNQAMDSWMRNPQNANKALTIHVLPAIVAYHSQKLSLLQTLQPAFIALEYINLIEMFLWICPYNRIFDRDERHG